VSCIKNATKHHFRFAHDIPSFVSVSSLFVQVLDGMLNGGQDGGLVSTLIDNWRGWARGGTGFQP
jgi:hypothetical protein